MTGACINRFFNAVLYLEWKKITEVWENGKNIANASDATGKYHYWVAQPIAWSRRNTSVVYPETSG